MTFIKVTSLKSFFTYTPLLQEYRLLSLISILRKNCILSSVMNASRLRDYIECASWTFTNFQNFVLIDESWIFLAFWTCINRVLLVDKFFSFPLTSRVSTAMLCGGEDGEQEKGPKVLIVREDKWREFLHSQFPTNSIPMNLRKLVAEELISECCNYQCDLFVADSGSISSSNISEKFEFVEIAKDAKFLMRRLLDEFP